MIQPRPRIFKMFKNLAIFSVLVKTRVKLQTCFELDSIHLLSKFLRVLHDQYWVHLMFNDKVFWLELLNYYHPLYKSLLFQMML